MKKTVYRIGLLVAAIMTLTACADFELKTRDDIRNEDKKPASTATNSSAPAAAPAAAVAPEKEDIDTQMRNLNGRVDEAENQVKQMTINSQADKDEAAKQNQGRDQKIAALEEEIKKLEAQVQTLNEQVNKPKPIVAADPTSYITEGDDLLAAKKHKEAIVSYQKYRDAMPKGGRYAEATYKIGMSFQELGMKDESKAFYEEVIGKFPKSQYAKNAAKKLKTLK
jgi:TolA-binding protein